MTDVGKVYTASGQTVTSPRAVLTIPGTPKLHQCHEVSAVIRCFMRSSSGRYGFIPTQLELTCLDRVKAEAYFDLL